MKIVFDEKVLEYKSPGHPESPERVKYAWQFLKSKGYQFIEPQEFPEDLIYAVHSPELVQKIKGANFYDPDTPAFPNIYFYARISVNAALTAYEVAKEEGSCLSLTRPPGHHAGVKFLGGFCYLNNIAIAVNKALSENKKVAILDLDAHHGNGTEDIFLGRENVIYISLHQSPLYPGTGHSSKDNVYNFPLPPGTRDGAYLRALDEALGILLGFGPDVVAISLGLDTYRDDPLTGLMLDEGCYERIGERLSKFRPCFFVLEGGYTDKLGLLIDLILSAFL